MNKTMLINWTSYYDGKVTGYNNCRGSKLSERELPA